MKNRLSDIITGGGGELIQILARRAVYAEGVRRVVLVRDDVIVLENGVRITVNGRGLVLRELGNSNVCADGKIDSVIFGETP